MTIAVAVNMPRRYLVVVVVVVFCVIPPYSIDLEGLSRVIDSFFSGYIYISFLNKFVRVI